VVGLLRVAAVVVFVMLIIAIFVWHRRGGRGRFSRRQTR
jgi:hypothetical protein